jgi:hypothetical protein
VPAIPADVDTKLRAWTGLPNIHPVATNRHFYTPAARTAADAEIRAHLRAARGGGGAQVSHARTQTAGQPGQVAAIIPNTYEVKIPTAKSANSPDGGAPWSVIATVVFNGTGAITGVTVFHYGPST